MQCAVTSALLAWSSLLLVAKMYTVGLTPKSFEPDFNYEHVDRVNKLLTDVGFFGAGPVAVLAMAAMAWRMRALRQKALPILYKARFLAAATPAIKAEAVADALMADGVKFHSPRQVLRLDAACRCACWSAGR